MSEGYSDKWVRVDLMVNCDTLEIHAIGGERKQGDGDMPYIGLELLKQKLDLSGIADAVKSTLEQIDRVDSKMDKAVDAVENLVRERDSLKSQLQEAHESIGRVWSIINNHGGAGTISLSHALGDVMFRIEQEHKEQVSTLRQSAFEEAAKIAGGYIPPPNLYGYQPDEAAELAAREIARAIHGAVTRERK